MQTSRSVDKTAYSDAISAESDTNTTYGEVIDVTKETAGAEQCELPTDGESPVKQSVRTCHSKTTQHETNWRDEASQSAENPDYRKLFTHMLSEF